MLSLEADASLPDRQGPARHSFACHMQKHNHICQQNTEGAGASLESSLLQYNLEHSEHLLYTGFTNEMFD